MTTFLSQTSCAEVYDFIKQFHFVPGYGVNPIEALVYSDATKVRLSPVEGLIKLRRDATTQLYPLDANIWARTWTTNPLALRKLKMIEIFPLTQPTGTSVTLRLNDGTDDYYWSGTDWEVAGDGDWNTEAEINAHITTFEVLPNREFAITMNLQTTDSSITPTVSEIRVLMEVHIDYIEDIIFRSMLPALEAGIRPVTNIANLAPYTEDVDTIDLKQYHIDAEYNIIDVTGVYDFTDDPELLTNLLSSYNPTTKVITLSVDLPSGHRPFILARYLPEFVYIQHTDWMEVAKLPMILIQQLEVPVAEAYNLVAREDIVDKGTYHGVVIPEPWRATFQFRLHGLTGSNIDEVRMMSKVVEFFEKNKMLRSVGLDEYYRMSIEREFRDLSVPGRNNQRVFWMRCAVYDVRMPMVSYQAHAVQSISFTFTGPKPTQEDTALGAYEMVAESHLEDGAVEWSETVER